MNPATSIAQELSLRLIALEALCDPVSDGGDSSAMRVCDKLRVSLVKFAGIGGYCTLASRALSMAKVEAPSLEPMQVGPDGLLEGFDQICTSQDTEATDLILVHLLSLLVTFIGERQTLALVRNAWPDDPRDKTQYKTEEQS